MTQTSRMSLIADRYRALVSERRFESDPAQAELVGKLDALADKLKDYKAGSEAERLLETVWRKGR